MNLTEHERKALSVSNAPVEVRDERTQQVYYVLSEDQYRKIKTLLEVESVDPSFYEFTNVELFDKNDE